MRLSTDQLLDRAEQLRELLSPCRLCPHTCGVDRLRGELGHCGVGPGPRIASAGPHFGEEAPLVGRRGSGTVFFSGCSLACIYCQNHTISHSREGFDLTVDALAGAFLAVQEQGCHNLNLVTPTHQAPAIVAALAATSERGFDLPVVWNCGGYERVEVLQLLEGIVDIYMPDAKYGDDEHARAYSGADGYTTSLATGLAEMQRQVGDLALDLRGVAVRGLLVRHLVLPNDLAGSERVFRIVAASASPTAVVNVMAQYRPCHRAHSSPELARQPRDDEIEAARRAAARAGLHPCPG